MNLHQIKLHFKYTFFLKEKETENSVLRTELERLKNQILLMERRDVNANITKDL